MDELLIKVPAPFSGVDDLGFSARHPAQGTGERLRDVTVFVEGPARPMGLLVERLERFCEKDALIEAGDDDAYTWTPPIRLSDEVCVLSFRDRSLDHEPVDPAAMSRGYVWNLVRPLAFTFLRDCVRLGGLRLSERIAVVIDVGRPPVVDLEIARAAITPANGTLLLQRSA